MSLPTLNGTARLIDTPDLRFSAQGTAVIKVRLAFNSRKKDPATEQWVDAESFFIDGKVFGQHAQNLADSLEKGLEVVVSGRMKTESWEKDGEKKSKAVLLIDSIGPALRYATAKVQKTGGSGQGRQEFQQARQQQASAEDPWAQSAPAGQAGGWGGGSGGYSEEPPPF